MLRFLFIIRPNTESYAILASLHESHIAHNTVTSSFDADIDLEICAVQESGLAMTPNTLMPQEATQPPPRTPEPAPPGAAAGDAQPSATTTPAAAATSKKTRRAKAQKSNAQPVKSQQVELQPATAAGATAYGASNDPAMNTPTPNPETSSQAQIDAEIAARKRQEIGLSPRRKTAQNEVLRPPMQSKGSGAKQLLLIGALSLVAVVLAWVLVSRFLAEYPTVAAVNDQFNRVIDGSVSSAIDSITTLSSDPSALLRTAGSLPIREEFTDEEGPLVRDFQPRRWSMGPVPDEGVYRIRMWPGVIAWSTLGVDPTPAYTLVTDMTIASETPWGFGGLMTRYSDPRNFLFAQIDGGGRYRVQMQRNGAWHTLQDWTEASVLRPAGDVNTLALEDNGVFAILYANGEAIYTTPDLDIPPGDAGVLAGSLDPSVAEVNFDRVEMTAPEY